MMTVSILVIPYLRLVGIGLRRRFGMGLSISRSSSFSTATRNKVFHGDSNLFECPLFDMFDSAGIPLADGRAG